MGVGGGKVIWQGVMEWLACQQTPYQHTHFFTRSLTPSLSFPLTYLLEQQLVVGSGVSDGEQQPSGREGGGEGGEAVDEEGEAQSEASADGTAVRVVHEQLQCRQPGVDGWMVGTVIPWEIVMGRGGHCGGKVKETRTRWGSSYAGGPLLVVTKQSRGQ